MWPSMTNTYERWFQASFCGFGSGLTPRRRKNHQSNFGARRRVWRIEHYRSCPACQRVLAVRQGRFVIDVMKSNKVREEAFFSSLATNYLQNRPSVADAAFN
jgi:hypothetical protein